MLYFLFLAIVVDYLYFKLKYSTPKGPPTWYGLPFVGMIPVLILPKFIYRPLYFHYLKYGPDVLLVRFFGPLLVTKGAATRAMYANEYCQSKPELKIMNYLGYIMTGKYGLVYTDGGRFDWRAHRKIDVAALYALPKREMVVKSSEAVDIFLREIEKHEGIDWDCDSDLLVSKYQESANLNLGSTFEEDDIKQFAEMVAFIFRSILLVSALVTCLSLSLLTRLEAFLPKVMRPSLVARVYNTALLALVQRRTKGLKDERTRDFVQATLRVKEPEEAHRYLCASSLFLMAANTHSTHHTILSTLTTLALNPDIQKKLYNEVESVLGRETLTLDHLDKMPYLRAVVMESNRLDSPFPFNLRFCTTPTNIHGYDVPGDLTIVILTHAENWDPLHFPQPKEYRPERFLDENGNYIRNQNIGIFGGGKRECPGKHINSTTSSVFLSKILQHYEVLASDASPERLEDRVLSPFPAPCKIPFRFIRRSKDFPLPTTMPSTEVSAIVKGVLQRI